MHIAQFDSFSAQHARSQASEGMVNLFFNFCENLNVLLHKLLPGSRSARHIIMFQANRYIYIDTVVVVPKRVLPTGGSQNLKLSCWNVSFVVPFTSASNYTCMIDAETQQEQVSYHHMDVNMELSSSHLVAGPSGKSVWKFNNQTLGS